MKIITSKRGEGRSTELIRQWKETGGLLIASSGLKETVLADADRSDCFFLTYAQVPTPNFLRGYSVNYIYIDDIDMLLLTFLGNAITSNQTIKIIGTICENHLEPLAKAETKKN